MGQEKEKIKAKGVEKKNEAGETSAGGGKNDDAVGGIATYLLKLDLHCEGCAKKVSRCVRNFEGVEDVKADSSTGKLTVKGNVDPLWLRKKVESKTKKQVALLSAQPKKVVAPTGGGGEKKSDEKIENKAEEKKGEDKKLQKVQCNTEVVRLHCDGSAQKVKRFIIKELAPYLKHKLKRNVAVVPPKKGDGSGGRGDKKKKKEVACGGGGGHDDKKKKKEVACGGGGGHDDKKKKKEVARGGGSGGGNKKKDDESMMASKSTAPKEQKTEVINKMEYYNGGYNNPNMYNAMPPPMYKQNYSNQDYGVTMQDHGYYGHSTGYVPPPYLTAPRNHDYGHSTGYVSPRHFTAPRDHGYGHTGYVPPPYSAPQYFSDENPNACSVM